MNAIQKMKFVEMMPPATANDGDFSGNTYVDTQGWDRLTVVIQTGSLAAAIGSTAEGTAPLVEECDTTGGSYTAVSGAALADAIGDGEDSQLHVIDIDLAKSHKRYMQVQAPHAGAGACYAGILGILSRSSSGAKGGSATDMGVDELVSA